MRTPGRPRRYYIFMQTSICRRITTLSAAHFRASDALQATYAAWHSPDSVDGLVTLLESAAHTLPG